MKKAPNQITLRFILLGDESERSAQYLWFKELEKTTLPAYMQALFQCNAPDRFQSLAHGEEEEDAS